MKRLLMIAMAVSLAAGVALGQTTAPAGANGAALVVGTWPMWLVPLVLFVLDHFVIIPFEERSMERAHGDAYRAYRGRVRRWI